MSTICWVKSRRLSTSTTASFLRPSSRASSANGAASMTSGSGCGSAKTTIPTAIAKAVVQVSCMTRMWFPRDMIQDGDKFFDPVCDVRSYARRSANRSGFF